MDLREILFAQFPAFFLLSLLFLIAHLRVRKHSAVKSVLWVLLFGAALVACALLCAAAYIVRVQNERALKQVCDFDSVHFAGRIWFDFKSGIRA